MLIDFSVFSHGIAAYMRTRRSIPQLAARLPPKAYCSLVRFFNNSSSGQSIRPHIDQIETAATKHGSFVFFIYILYLLLLCCFYLINVVSFFLFSSSGQSIRPHIDQIETTATKHGSLFCLCWFVFLFCLKGF